MTDRMTSPSADSPRTIAGFLKSITAERILESIEYLLLLILFLACSTPYRLSWNAYSVSLAELSAVAYILWRWIAGGRKDAETDRTTRWMIRGLWILAAWSGLIWLLSGNWNTRREMVFDWILAVLTLSCLLRSPIKDWRRIAFLFVAAGLPNVVLGVLQHVQGIGLAPKDFSGWRRGAATFPIYGYFKHPNDLAVFLYWPFLVSAGLVFSRRTAVKILFAIITILYGMVLYWTISRSTLITAVCVALLVPFMLLIPKRKSFRSVLAAGAVLGILALAGILLTQPIGRINVFLSGRLELWGGALQVIRQDPYLLPIGYLLIPPKDLLVFWIPHNIYLLSWIEFGWPGILLLTGWAAYFLWSGWRRYEGLHRHRSAAVLWLGIAGLFLVNGMATLYFHETHMILNFVCVTALWIAQIREIDASNPTALAGKPVGADSPPAGVPPVSEAV